MLFSLLFVSFFASLCVCVQRPFFSYVTYANAACEGPFAMYSMTRDTTSIGAVCNKSCYVDHGVYYRLQSCNEGAGTCLDERLLPSVEYSGYVFFRDAQCRYQATNNEDSSGASDGRCMWSHDNALVQCHANGTASLLSCYGGSSGTCYDCDVWLSVPTDTCKLALGADDDDEGNDRYLIATCDSSRRLGCDSEIPSGPIKQFFVGSVYKSRESCSKASKGAIVAVNGAPDTCVLGDSCFQSPPNEVGALPSDGTLNSSWKWDACASPRLMGPDGVCFEDVEPSWGAYVRYYDAECTIQGAHGEKLLYFAAAFAQDTCLLHQKSPLLECYDNGTYALYACEGNATSGACTNCVRILAPYEGGQDEARSDGCVRVLQGVYLRVKCPNTEPKFCSSSVAPMSSLASSSDSPVSTLLVVAVLFGFGLFVCLIVLCFYMILSRRGSAHLHKMSNPKRRTGSSARRSTRVRALTSSTSLAASRGSRSSYM